MLLIVSVILFCLSVSAVAFAWIQQAREEARLLKQVVRSVDTTKSPLILTAPSPTVTSAHTAANVALRLTPEQAAVFSVLEYTNDHVFVTGKAGTGKSMLLQYFQAHTRKRIVVVAPTGAAALQVGGQTIHSLFHLPMGFIQEQGLSIDMRTAKLLRHIDALVIDETSMVRVDTMEAIHRKLQMARKSDIPFGGVQIILFGDPYQLPPVCEDDLERYMTNRFGGPYFFNAPVWKEAMLRMYELRTVHRQRDGQFRQVLNAIRQGMVNDEVLETINKRAGLPVPKGEIVTLTGHTAVVMNLNKKRLAAVPGREHVYMAEVNGKLTQTTFPADAALQLKVGAQVMLLKNDRQRRWANGTVGMVRALGKDEVRIAIHGHIHTVYRETWNKIRYTYDTEKDVIAQDIVSAFTQFPVRLAWAMTIHKAQGQTYESVSIDLTHGVFAYGQTYVALSRCTSLEGVYLTRPIRREDIMVDPRITEFMQRSTNMVVT